MADKSVAEGNRALSYPSLTGFVMPLLPAAVQSWWCHWVQAGTYGVLVLFGVMPAAMVYSERSFGSTVSTIRVVPGGRPLIVAVGGTAAVIIGNEVVHALMSVQQ